MQNGSAHHLSRLGAQGKTIGRSTDDLHWCSEKHDQARFRIFYLRRCRYVVAKPLRYRHNSNQAKECQRT